MALYWNFPSFPQVAEGNTEYQTAGFSFVPVHVIANEQNGLTEISEVVLPCHSIAEPTNFKEALRLAET